MNIPFLFVFRWLIPEAKGLSRAEVAEIIEKARLASFPRIRKYSGWALVFSFVFPFLIFFPPAALVYLLCSDIVKPIATGMFSIMAGLSVIIMMSIFNTLILRPAIYEYLTTSLRLQLPLNFHDHSL